MGNCIIETQKEHKIIEEEVDEIIKGLYTIQEHSVSPSHFSITSAVERSLVRKDNQNIIMSDFTAIRMIEFDFLNFN